MARSLALTADAAHVCMDAVALGIAVAAATQASRPPTDRQSYGFARFEIIAALIDGMQIVRDRRRNRRRGRSPLCRTRAPPRETSMFAIGAVGFAGNVGIGFTLLRSARKDLSVRSAPLSRRQRCGRLLIRRSGGQSCF